MTDDQMKPNRYLRWAKARKLVRDIQAHLAKGGKVVIGTHVKATVYSPKHIDMFKATKSGALVQHGKGWDCIDFCVVRFV